MEKTATCHGPPPDSRRRTTPRKRVSLNPEFLALLDKLPSDSLKQELLKKYRKPFENTPELCALYLMSAGLKMKNKEYQSALADCELLLRQKEIYRYREVKSLQIRLLSCLKRYFETRRACQELLLTELSADEKREIILTLSESWESSGESGKAIAQAWSAVPVTGMPTDKKIQSDIRKLLLLIIRNAEKINSPEDKNDALALLKEIQ